MQSKLAPKGILIERLLELKKLRNTYGGLRAKKTKRLVEAAKETNSPGYELLKSLELRLQTIVFRTGYCKSIRAARQLVSHGHVRINGDRVVQPSYRVKEGQFITIDPHIGLCRLPANPAFDPEISKFKKPEECDVYISPPYLLVHPKYPVATLLREPSPAEVKVISNLLQVKPYRICNIF
ncbi:30S ribosomal protein S4 [Galdieria sulphuraria]|uniref:30S ribosomal protein S4 (Plastid) n=1 Tax=Galdieria sulphuraria TaxID=130081 RepID=M2XYL3_GALSU|nr:30S ribosomal protein S4 [Galdieria sulphuraria]EME28564.1 30S ribosomal protein S4 [Galdieria sulphuraria]|eukprot:XP_005705084.1 30S ribosomal protein S4 [Galdieria sulphuraria]